MQLDIDYWSQVAAAQAAGGGAVDERGSLVVFYDRPVQDDRETKRQGRPVFTSRPYVTIQNPGQSRTVVERPVDMEGDPVHGTPSDPERFPRAWARYQDRRTGVDGTPLEEWPYLSATRVAELKAGGFLVLEQIAKCPDSNLKRLGMDGRALRERAEQYLAGEEETVRDLRAKLMELEQANQSLAARLEAALAPADEESEEPFAQPAKRGPGRPSQGTV